MATDRYALARVHGAATNTDAPWFFGEFKGGRRLSFSLAEVQFRTVRLAVSPVGPYGLRCAFIDQHGDFLSSRHSAPLFSENFSARRKICLCPRPRAYSPSRAERTSGKRKSNEWTNERANFRIPLDREQISERTSDHTCRCEYSPPSSPKTWISLLICVRSHEMANTDSHFRLPRKPVSV